MTLADHHTGDNAGFGQRPGPRIAVVIPALDEAPSIARVIEGLQGQALLASGEIIVVDNGSTDDSIATIRAGYPTRGQSSSSGSISGCPRDATLA